METNEYAGIECVKEGFRVRLGRKTYLPGYYITLYQAEQALLHHQGAAKAAAAACVGRPARNTKVKADA